MQRTWILLGILTCVMALIAIQWPRIRQLLGPTVGKALGDAYQKRMVKQLRKQYPAVAERITDFEMSSASQEQFQANMKRLPPQEAQKLQLEFTRLRENFVVRHPEVAPLFDPSPDGKAQAQALDVLLKLPADKRQSLEKDLLWAWDHLRGRFPRLMGSLESSFKKKPLA